MTNETNTPTPDNNAIGALGEKCVDLALSNYVGNQEVLFRPDFMGEKSHLLDFLVRVLDEDNSSKTRAEYFFAQVKTVHSEDSVYPQKAAKPTSIDIEFTERDVLQAQSLHVPVYLFAVDARTRDLKAYVAGISSFRKKGKYRVRTDHDLASEATLRLLKDDVGAYFAQMKKIKFTSKFDNAKDPEPDDNA